MLGRVQKPLHSHVRAVYLVELVFHCVRVVWLLYIFMALGPHRLGLGYE